MTPAEIAALKERAYRHYAIMAWTNLKVGRKEALALITLAEQALRLREAAQAVVDEIDNSSEWISLEPRVDALRAALAQAHGDGE